MTLHVEQLTKCHPSRAISPDAKGQGLHCSPTGDIWYSAPPRPSSFIYYMYLSLFNQMKIDWFFPPTIISYSDNHNHLLPFDFFEWPQNCKTISCWEADIMYPPFTCQRLPSCHTEGWVWCWQVSGGRQGPSSQGNSSEQQRGWNCPCRCCLASVLTGQHQPVTRP